MVETMTDARGSPSGSRMEQLGVCDTFAGRTDDVVRVVTVPANNGGKSVVNVSPQAHSIDPTGEAQ